MIPEYSLLVCDVHVCFLADVVIPESPEEYVSVTEQILKASKGRPPDEATATATACHGAVWLTLHLSTSRHTVPYASAPHIPLKLAQLLDYSVL